MMETTTINDDETTTRCQRRHDKEDDKMTMQRRRTKTAFVWVKFTILVDTRLSFFVILYQRINERKHIVMRRSGLGGATKRHAAYIIIGKIGNPSRT